MVFSFLNIYKHILNCCIIFQYFKISPASSTTSSSSSAHPTGTAPSLPPLPCSCESFYIHIPFLYLFYMLKLF